MALGIRQASKSSPQSEAYITKLNNRQSWACVEVPTLFLGFESFLKSIFNRKLVLFYETSL